MEISIFNVFALITNMVLIGLILWIISDTDSYINKVIAKL